MYKYKKNRIEINGHHVDFKYDIRTVIRYKERYIILLEIPKMKVGDKKRNKEIEPNNIYCLNDQANLVWQLEDRIVRYPEYKCPLSYVGMSISGNVLYAADFNGWTFHINPENGKIEGRHFTK